MRFRPAERRRAYRCFMPDRLVSAEFERFVARHFGSEGRAWLDQLPERVAHYEREWELAVDTFLPGGLLSCCLGVRTATGDEAVLKIRGPWTRADAEVLALTVWRGGPAAELFRADRDGDAVLLERIRPGHHFDPSADGLSQFVELLDALHGTPVHPETAERLPRLVTVVESQIATAGEEAAARSGEEATALQPHLERARERASVLLACQTDAPVLLHGDLENKNILRCDKRGLVAIDPLPCVGDRTYDAGYWLSCAIDESERDTVAVKLASAVGLDATRIREWARVVALEA